MGKWTLREPPWGGGDLRLVFPVLRPVLTWRWMREEEDGKSSDREPPGRRRGQWTRDEG